MLQKIRDRATGPLAWFIVAIICVPFAFFGIEAFRTDGGTTDVAKVGGETISEAELTRQYEQRYQQLQQMLGENFRSDLIDPDVLRRNVLDGLIQSEVNRQYLRAADYGVSDQQVLAFVQGQEAFQSAGAFSPSQYRDVLARQGMNPIQYEDRVREFLVTEQLRRAIGETVLVTEQELARAYAHEHQQRSFAYRRYQAAVLRDEITISDEQIAERYEQRKASLKAPERVRIAYLELSRDALKQDIDASDEELRALYAEQKDTRFTVPEERKARHILIRESTPDAQDKIESLAGELAQGADFAELAKEHSEDPGSKNQGGDLGWVSRGVMVPAFEQALFSLPEGQVSEPVESSFGWHLIRLDELRPARVRDFDDAREEVLNLYRERQARERFDALAEQLEQLSFENPASLEPAAESLGLEIQESGWFTRQGGAGITAQDAVIEAAFSSLVLENEENSQPIALGNRQVVLRVLAHEPERPQTLEEVQEQLRAELKREGVAAELKQRAEADLATLEASSDQRLENLSESPVAENVAAQSITRNSNELPRALVNAVFSMEPPADNGARYRSVPLPGGDYALLEFTQAVDGDWAQADEAERETTRERIVSRLANQEYAALEAALRADSKIKVYREEF